ncbi:MAG: DUF6600 domain-containing protein [Acidobacteriota bacterium]
MKHRVAQIAILVLGTAVVLACARPPMEQLPPPYVPYAAAPPGVGEDADLFFDELTPYGSWIWLEGPGWVWYPYNVSVDWRPYVYGHWVYTDYGWTWVSEEDWGWAVYHYGRWLYDPSYGWVWVPGSVWGPAWVVWHRGGGWVGWAPLPWQVGWQVGIGLEWGHIDVHVALDPTWWCFTKTRYLVEPGLRRHIVPAARNVTLIKITKNVTKYTIIENRIINQGVEVHIVRKAMGRPVPRFRVRHAGLAQGARRGKLKGKELLIFRPEIARDQPSPARAEPARPAKRRHPRATRPPAAGPSVAPSPGTGPPPPPPGQAQRQQAGPPPPPPGQARRREAGPPPPPPGQARRQEAGPPPVPRRQVRQHEKATRRLESRQAREREKLEQIHTRESRNPPAGVSHNEVNRRQDAEHRTLKSKQEREHRLLEQRHKREQIRQRPGRPSSRGEQSGKVKSGKPKSEKPEPGKSKSEKSKSDKSKPEKKEKSKPGGSDEDEP